MANHSECCVCSCVLFFMSVRSLHLNGNRGSKLPPSSSSAITAAYYNYAGGEFPQNHPTVSLRVWLQPRVAGCECYSATTRVSYALQGGTKKARFGRIITTFCGFFNSFLGWVQMLLKNHSTAERTRRQFRPLSGTSSGKWEASSPATLCKLAINNSVPKRAAGNCG